MMATFIVLYGLGSYVLGFLMGGWVMYNYYTKGGDVEKPVGRYTIDWSFVVAIGYLLAVSFTAMFLFADFPSTIKDYKALAFIAVTFGPILFLLSFKKET